MDLLRERRARLAALLGGLIFIACLMLEAWLAELDGEGPTPPDVVLSVTDTSS